MSRAEVRRIVLVGFMGSGKSTVGPLLAAALGWRFHDVDAHIEGREGMSVAELFERRGEAWFREAEAREAAALLAEDEVVVATGGGWGATPGRLAALPEGTSSVWLRVGAETALRRVAAEPGRRPLLDVEDPLSAARGLLAARAPHYGVATLEVDTEGRSAEDVSSRILDGVRAAATTTHTRKA